MVEKGKLGLYILIAVVIIVIIVIVVVLVERKRKSSLDSGNSPPVVVPPCVVNFDANQWCDTSVADRTKYCESKTKISEGNVFWYNAESQRCNKCVVMPTGTWCGIVSTDREVFCDANNLKYDSKSQNCVRPISCVNGKVSDDWLTCTCNTNWSGQYCDKCLMNEDRCNMNAGKYDSTNCVCTCFTGASGQYCDTRTGLSKDICVVKNSSSTLPFDETNKRCNCVGNWKGVDCSQCGLNFSDPVDPNNPIRMPNCLSSDDCVYTYMNVLDLNSTSAGAKCKISYVTDANDNHIFWIGVISAVGSPDSYIFSTQNGKTPLIYNFTYNIFQEGVKQQPLHMYYVGSNRFPTPPIVLYSFAPHPISATDRPVTFQYDETNMIFNANNETVFSMFPVGTELRSLFNGSFINYNSQFKLTCKPPPNT